MINNSINIIVKSFLIIYCISIAHANAEERLRIAGSKTLYYFLTFVVEDYTKLKHKISPVLEATGSGSGFNLFCTNKVNIAASSRQILPEEIDLCKRNGIKNLKEFILGYDAIILVVNKNSKLKNISLADLNKAIAGQLALKSNIIENFYNNWHQIRQDLPKVAIQVYGPSLHSGTKQILMTKLSEKFCLNNIIFNLKFPELGKRKRHCMASRKDLRYIEVGENLNLLVQKALDNKNAVVILNYSHLCGLEKDIRPISIDGVLPNNETISREIYPFTRKLYLYYNNDEYQENANINNFFDHLKNSDLLGPNGILSSKGLIFK